MDERLSIRVKITLSTIMLALVGFAATAVGVHFMAEQLLADSMSSLVKADIATVETAIINEPSDTVDAPSEGQLMAVIDPGGAEHVSTLPDSLRSNLGDLNNLPDADRHLTIGSNHYFVVIDHVQSPKGIWTIVAARDQSSTENVMNQVTTVSIIGLAVLVLLFGLASWVMTGAALRPVERLRASAERIVATGSNELLPVTTARDEVQHLAATLNQLIAGLRASVERERQMVSDVSHELRTPLAVLQGQLELLRRGDRGHLDEDIADAERAAGRLTHVVADLLELSRLEATQDHSFSSKPAELLDEAGEAVDRARFANSERDLDIEFSIDGHAPRDAVIGMRPTTFGRLIDNLLSNAVAAMNPGGRIDVAITLDAQHLVLQVMDTGHGIPESFIPHAFDRFSRPDSARSKRSGAGLGLSLVAAATQVADGTVTLANREDQVGAIATVTLPFRPHHA